MLSADKEVDKSNINTSWGDDQLVNYFRKQFAITQQS